MAFECDICGKKPASGNNVSHSNRKTRRTWRPNLQTVHIVLPNGTRKTARVCTRCLRSNKITKAV